MDDTKKRLVLGWLAKADQDLRAARLMILEEKRLLSVGAYHCQQAAEKALKAWLTCRDIIFPKTHDLEALLHLCRNANPAFAAYIKHAQVLTPLATEFRYPGDVFEPEPASARSALQLAEEVVAYCDQQSRKEMTGD